MSATQTRPSRNGNAHGGDNLLVTLQTPMSGRALAVRAPAEASLADVLRQVQERAAPTDPEDARVLQNIRSEAVDGYKFLVRGQDGRRVPVGPDVTVGSCTVTQEVRNPDGSMDTRAATVVTIQSYQKVGG